GADGRVAHAGGLSDRSQADVARRAAHRTSAVSPACDRFHRGVGGNLGWMDDLPPQSSHRTRTVEPRHADADRCTRAPGRGFAKLRAFPGGEQMLNTPRSDCRDLSVTHKRSNG